MGEIALKGTLTIETTLINNQFIATPGGKNSDDANAPEFYRNGTRGSAPLYNKPVGKFTLLKAPVFGLSVVHNNNVGYAAYLKTKEKPYIAHNHDVLGKIDDIINIGLHVETYDRQGRRVSGKSEGSGYTNFFLSEDANPLPGSGDITGMIDWEQIEANIADGGNINTELHKWVKISYELWSITASNIKARDLSRVFASGDNFYTGNTNLKYHEVNVNSYYKLKNKAKEKAGSDFNNYTFSDNETWGENYNIYNASLDFEDLMQSYCENLNGGPALAAKAQVLENAAEEPEIIEESLVVYPNPSSDVSNFRLTTEAKGKVSITLYDLSGKELIHTTDILNGRDVLQGKINITPLKAGVYILKVILPNGQAITERIVKN